MKFVVIDDDPTGSQTVYDCLLLLKWDCSTLVKGFESKSNLFFILAIFLIEKINFPSPEKKYNIDVSNDIKKL